MSSSRLLALGFLCCTAVHANEASDVIVVTATRTETPIDDVIVPVTVIDRATIELSGASDLAELLRFEAGLEIGRNGGPGQATSVFIRGTESNHTLVLVDGVRMNPGTIGGAALQHVNPEMIERIEIVKGARSALYGTEAIGGVINIITRRAARTGIDAGIGGGSFNTRNGFLNGSWTEGDLSAGVTVDFNDTDGFSTRTNADIDRGYDNASVGVSLEKRYDSGSVGFRHWNASGNVEYLDFFLTPVDQDFENRVTSIEWSQDVGESGGSRLIVANMQDNIEQSQGPDFVESTRTTLDWQYSQTVGDHSLTAGIFLFEEQAETLSFGSGFDEDTSMRALFVQDQWQGERTKVFLAARYSDHETFGNELTWNAELAFDATDRLTLSAGAARAFRAPDATDRFGFGGNADLDAEVSQELQAGLRYNLADNQRLSLNLYNNNIDELIEFDNLTFSLINIDEVTIRGAELSYDFEGDGFNFGASYINQRADNDTTGTRLLRRAEESLSLRYRQNVGRHQVGLSLLASGDREDFGGTRLAGYVLANLTAQFRLSDRIQLNARVENLLDTEYETAAGFRMQELSGFIELRTSWN